MGNTSDENQVESPCIRHCCLDEADVCLGCFRTLDEILHWQQSNSEQKRIIINRCQRRKQARLNSE